LAVPGTAQNPIPGKSYEYYVVAKTGATFTSLGSGPSINDVREVAFEGSTSAGNALWYGATAAGVTNFNPSESFGSSDIISPDVQISANHQVVSEDRIGTTSPATTSIRLYTATANDSFAYTARGGPSRTYDAVFANPAVNLNGDVVFTAFHPTPTKVLGYAPHGGGTIVERTIISGNPKPMIADDGTVVVQVGGTGTQSNQQILVYPPGLGSPFVVADTNNHWVSLDNDPGISRDGRIVAFQGNVDAVGAAAIGTTNGPGIFVAIDEGAGFGSAKILRITGTRVEDVAADRAASKGNLDGICDLAEICKSAAELGFDASGNPITIASYGADSRVGVANVDFGAAGIDGDSFVISFIATPSSASRDNPMLPGTPLLFSAQQGLWTIRVDVQTQLAGTARVYHPFTPIPVVQIGDRIGGDTVTGIGVYDPIANAAHDESGGIRTMRRGDHRVAFWASTNNGQIVVRANHLDSDQDGLLDHWETTGIDMDQDGVVDLDLSAFGVDPFTRDVMIQVDWVGTSNFTLLQPAGGVFSSDIAGTYSQFEGNFRNAEALSGANYGVRIDGANPIDIKAGIVPHVDAGRGLDSLGLPLSINLGVGASHGGNVVTAANDPMSIPSVVYFGQPGLTVPNTIVRPYQDIKDTYFGAADKDARLLAFHYILFSPFQDFIPNYPDTPYLDSIDQVFDANTIEIDQPPANVPSLPKGAFVEVTTGNAAATVRQISSLAVDGNTGKLILNLGSPFTTLPSIGDSVVFLEGSTGNSEVAFAPSPDNNSLPGNDAIVSVGAMGAFQGVPPNPCMESETASHELGHTLGLRHGGTDHTSHKGNQYLSVMSYSWQLVCTPTPPITHYSTATDPTFDDYAHLQFNFSDVMFHLSTSLGEARGEGNPSVMRIMDPEETLLDYIAQNGPLDTVPPAVAITSPGGNSSVAPGGNLTVNVAASDNGQVNRVTVSFDLNGDGVLEAGESVVATPAGNGRYQAAFSNVSGPNGTRPLTAIAWDNASNSSLASISLTVGTVVYHCSVTGAPTTTVSDVQALVNESLGGATAAHDLNKDGVINVADIQIVIDAALGLPCKAQ
jgi:hypothetical protein